MLRCAVVHKQLTNIDILLSLLDSKNERQVQMALDQASKGRTTIIVAHRLSTVRRADKIIVLKAGQVFEQGTHAELMELGGYYAQSVEAQRLTDPGDDDEEDENGENNASGKCLIYVCEILREAQPTFSSAYINQTK